MGNKYLKTLFTDPVKAIQETAKSRLAYDRMTKIPRGNEFSKIEMEFMTSRDSFYMATISESGWPYVQHRGGKKGFVRLIDSRTFEFDDYKGNNQFISKGNLITCNKVSIIFVDYPNRRRLKILGYAMIKESKTRISLVGFDWNCPKYITPRWTEEEHLDRGMHIKGLRDFLKE